MQAATVNKKDAALYSKMFKPSKESPVDPAPVDVEAPVVPAGGAADGSTLPEVEPMETEAAAGEDLKA